MTVLAKNFVIQSDEEKRRKEAIKRRSKNKTYIVSVGDRHKCTTVSLSKTDIGQSF